MVLQDLLAGGVEYVQDSQPSDADAGEIWLDTSVDPSALKIYDASSDVWDEAQASNLDAPVSNIQNELQSGRTRELLLLLQDKPVPEVQDPLNIQSGLSSGYEQSSSDYQIVNGGFKTIYDFEDGNGTPSDSAWNTLDAADVSTSQPSTGSYSYEIAGDIQEQMFDSGSINPDKIQFDIRAQGFTGDGTDYLAIRQGNSSGGINVGFEMDGTIYDNEANNSSGEQVGTWNDSTWYTIEFVLDWDNDTFDIVKDGSTIESGQALTVSDINKLEIFTRTSTYDFYLDNIAIDAESKLNAEITDSFASPTTIPADFKAWEAIRAEDVAVGGSTSANPVEFEILDSTDTVLNSTRIPKARIADEPFVMRNRVYTEDAGSDDQSDYQISTTEDGGHFGIPVLTVVSVKQNGSVLDSANWSFNLDTDTVTIDTSNVTIASGDTIDIKYDFDVFDSTLQPRVYLSRESASETSPSIGHFRYEYVI